MPVVSGEGSKVFVEHSQLITDFLPVSLGLCGFYEPFLL